jgi:hypothetical protein
VWAPAALDAATARLRRPGGPFAADAATLTAALTTGFGFEFEVAPDRAAYLAAPRTPGDAPLALLLFYVYPPVVPPLVPASGAARCTAWLGGLDTEGRRMPIRTGWARCVVPPGLGVGAPDDRDLNWRVSPTDVAGFARLLAGVLLACAGDRVALIGDASAALHMADALRACLGADGAGLVSRLSMRAYRPLVGDDADRARALAVQVDLYA